MKTIRLLDASVKLAPDGSKIHPLLTVKRGGMAYCNLPPGATSKAVSHKTIEEIWFFLQGSGQVWRKKGNQETIVDVEPGICITIETGTNFQFRNTGSEALCFIIATMPPWPGYEEAVRVDDYWDIE